MTSTDTTGLAVGAYLPREDPRDALCGADGCGPGCGSARPRCAGGRSCSRSSPASPIEPLRGNVDTRLRKRGERGLDAIVLAAAGLDRLGLAAEIGYRFEPDELLPEAGQGAVALQVRAGEEELVRRRTIRRRAARVEAERACVSQDRRRLPRAGRRLPRRHGPDRARRRRGRGLDRAAERRAIPCARRRAPRRASRRR